YRRHRRHDARGGTASADAEPKVRAPTGAARRWSPPMSLLQGLWSSLSASPVSGIAITLLSYQLGCWLQRRLNGNPLCNPVLIAIACTIAVLLLTGTSYRDYFK